MSKKSRAKRYFKRKDAKDQNLYGKIEQLCRNYTVAVKKLEESGFAGCNEITRERLKSEVGK